MNSAAPLPICLFCGHERENLDGYHSCQAAQDQKAYIEKQIDEYTRIAESKTPTKPNKEYEDGRNN